MTSSDEEYGLEDFDFEELYASLVTGTFFSCNDAEALQLLYRVYHDEIEYLKSAYAAAYPCTSLPTTPSPSEILFESRYPEVDRTLTGVLALRWIRNQDYEAFTNNHGRNIKLTAQSFGKLFQFFHINTEGFEDAHILLTLITMQIMNDLGKSSELEQDLSSRLPSHVQLSENHDMILHQALRYCADLIPAFGRLKKDQKETVLKLIELSAEFNPAQLAQAECPPVALESLVNLEVGEEELDLKFMEIFLDVAGSKGHVNHEGAATMIEPVFQSYWNVRKLCEDVVADMLTPQQAYEHLLLKRLDMLHKAGWTLAEDFANRINIDLEVYAKARILCVGRVADVATADLFNSAYDSLSSEVRRILEEELTIDVDGVDSPAVQATYMPAMFALALATPQPRQAISVLLIYLSRVLDLGWEDLDDLPKDAVIVERDVKDILESRICSDAFKQDPASALNETTPLPPLQIAKRRRSRRYRL